MRLPCTLAMVFAVGIFSMPRALADAETDWQEILATESGPQQTEWKSRDEARSVAVAHLIRQEQALRNFIAKYPDDSRWIDAQLRLAHLLAVRGDLEGSEKARTESAAILNGLERSPTTPKERLADVAFARLSLFMRRVDVSDARARQTLLNKAQTFQKTFPQDARIASLLAEVATLFDSEPQQKKSLLEQAQALATDEDLKQRIDDDLKRLAMLGKPLAMQWTSIGGQDVDLAKLRGRVVLIYFFAAWSPPAMAELDWVKALADQNTAGAVQTLGISLDENREALAGILATHKINWPVFFDGKSWESPLVRSLGINSLPTLWIVDRRGNLRAINARGEASAIIAQLLRER